MKVIKGDLIKLAQEGYFDVIVQGCNCFCTMGKGIALQIKKVFPAVYIADCETRKGDKYKLGTISHATIDTPNGELVVVNAYTQFDYRIGHTSDTKRRVDYKALRSCFREVKQYFSGRRIGYPLIGAGLAGGDWNVIEKIIDQELVDEDHTLVKWEFSRYR